jgi:glycosyltransferase involved in cell wall biosynthesis
LISLRSIASTLRLVDRIIVHQPEDAHRLADMDVRDNVVAIPHGTPRPPAAEPNAVRHALGLGDRPVVGTFGFLLPHKGIMSLIDAVDRLRVVVPDVTLLALCATYPISTSEDHEKYVREQIAHRHLSDNVLLVSDFLPAEVARTTLRAADVIALPYQATEESASGAMRFVLSVERPVIATDLPIFDDAADAFFRVPPDDNRQLTDAIRRFLDQEPLRRRWAQRAGSYSRKTDWSRIAFEHAAIYAQARASHLRRAEL